MKKESKLQPSFYAVIHYRQSGDYYTGLTGIRRITMRLQVTKQMIVDDLRKLGLKDGDAVLVHSSLSRIGYVEGGAETVIDALIEAVGDTGTVLVPTLTGSEKLSAENPPVFDVRTTPCWTGTIPETFRKRPNAIRSLHPTHSVAAIGAQAVELTEGGEKATMPCCYNTPYERLIHMDNGRILMLGCGLGCCTTLHCIEELAGVPDRLLDGVAAGTVYDYDGNKITVNTRLHFYGPALNYPVMNDSYISEGIMVAGKIGEADSLLIKAKEMAEYTLEALKYDIRLLFAKEE